MNANENNILPYVVASMILNIINNNQYNSDYQIQNLKSEIQCEENKLYNMERARQMQEFNIMNDNSYYAARMKRFDIVCNPVNTRMQSIDDRMKERYSREFEHKLSFAKAQAEEYERIKREIEDREKWEKLSFVEKLDRVIFPNDPIREYFDLILKDINEKYEKIIKEYDRI